ncbi:MAG: DUF4394 domain-containing protein [Gammaproteobacteria bacterium]|nr:DUF4394 domain-containing protein [Gammaproteobacteria bacterium]MBU1441992.1 DUF4394 domain-containing protein [Gammaproteobacteria bacterium]MBU2288465.1 DUF4394 domain-containing protein [Gammaproteobacteria bacterium]MBU2410572.1 DUF4394 domain-containing protein [Gammaproteobacteria bacterium]
MSFRRSALSSALSFAVLGLAACGGGGGNDSPALPVIPGTPIPPVGSGPVQVGDTIALAAGNLISFNRAAPGTLVGTVAVTGVPSGESLLGIDIRPADGKLYALGSTGKIYLLDPATGQATFKSALTVAAGDDNPFAALDGTRFAVDFNPAADRLRVISNTGQDLRVNVDTGAAITDGTISPATSSITAAAYTNSFAGTATTQLYDLDVTAGRLHLQDPPNNGTLNAGVTLGVTADSVNGFDIDATNNAGFAALTVGGETALYRINLGATANAATKVGTIAGGAPITGLALAATPAPTAYALTKGNLLAAFDPLKPNTFTKSAPITGLSGGESLLGIDFRPKNGVLYGLSTAARLFTIDPATGAATLIGPLVADPADATLPFAALTGTSFSVDFNPVADRLRVIGNDGQDLRIAVETVTANGVTTTAGFTTTDGVINRASAPASVIAAAYTNSFAGTTATSLYNLEQNQDVLTLQNPPNDGVLVDVGKLGIDIASTAGFDIGGGANGLVLAALRAGNAGPFSLYTISLTTGAATLFQNTSGNAALSQIGGAGGPDNLIDVAIKF